jgi:hypothetical protein
VLNESPARELQMGLVRPHPARSAARKDESFDVSHENKMRKLTCAAHA